MLHLFGVAFDVLVAATLYLVTANGRHGAKDAPGGSSCHFVKLTVRMLACILDPVVEYERKEKKKNLLRHQYDKCAHDKVKAAFFYWPVNRLVFTR